MLRKRYFLRFAIRIRTQTQNHAKGVYIINSIGIVYHQRLAVVYHHCERGYSLRLMICTFGDEIHAKAWWYTIAFAMDKKIRQVETCRIFWRRWRDSNSRTAFDGYTISNRARSTSYATSPNIVCRSATLIVYHFYSILSISIFEFF